MSDWDELPDVDITPHHEDRPEAKRPIARIRGLAKKVRIAKAAKAQHQERAKKFQSFQGELAKSESGRPDLLLRKFSWDHDK